MKELIFTMIHPLVTKPDAVELTEVPGGHQTKFVLRVDPADIGRLIGREGKTVKAMRILLSTAAGLQQSEASLEIEERRDA